MDRRVAFAFASVIIAAVLTFSFIIAFKPFQKPLQPGNGGATSNSNSASNNIIVVPDDYVSIQEAIDNAGEGGTVFVKSGTYHNQTLSINKSLSLIGEDSQTTILKSKTEITPFSPFGGLRITSVIELKANNIRISGFTIDHYDRGISGSGNGIQIIDNIFKANWDHESISVFGSCIEIKNNSIYGGRKNIGICAGGSYNIISENKIVRTSTAILLWDNSCIVSKNEIIDSGANGIYVSGNLHTITQNRIIGGEIGSALTCSRSIISENIAINQTARALWLDNIANDNIIWGNILSPNLGYAIYLTVLTGTKGPVNNTFYLNTIMGNVYLTGRNPWNFWDNGEKGNYWSDYEDKYPNAKELDGSGVWDTPYVIGDNNQDNYPLINPITIPEFSW